jgi:hypothetical protein
VNFQLSLKIYENTGDKQYYFVGLILILVIMTTLSIHLLLAFFTWFSVGNISASLISSNQHNGGGVQNSLTQYSGSGEDSRKHSPDHYYVFSYFNNNGKDGLHLAGSRDGFRWRAFKNDQSFLKPLVGKDSIMRDPCIIKGLDGQFHLVWTDSWTDKGIGYASSADLIHWSKQKFIPVMAKEDSARNCWAPEITLDPISKIYMIYWATTIKGKFAETYSPTENGYNHRIYYVTTKDFKSFSDTRLLYDPGFNVIDATIVRDGGQYIMF